MEIYAANKIYEIYYINAQINLPNSALTTIIMLAKRIAVMCTNVSFDVLGDETIGITALLITDATVIFGWYISENNFLKFKTTR